MINNNRATQFLLTTLFILALAACTPSAIRKTDDDRLADAQTLIDQGQYAKASDIYSQLAKQSQSTVDQEHYRLRAAEALINNNLYSDGGREKFDLISNTLSSNTHQSRYSLLEAAISLVKNQPESALSALPNPAQVKSPSYRARLYSLQAQAHALLKNPEQQLLSHIHLHRLLIRQSDKDQNITDIWKLLDEQSVEELHRLTRQIHDDTYQGWLEIALILRPDLNNTKQLSSQVSGWKQRFSDHPAINEITNSKISNSIASTPNNINSSNIAVLLPLSGNTASIAKSIRDGLISAYLEDTTSIKKPQIRFYDTNQVDFISTYYQAAHDGANIIIGPLKKTYVDQLRSINSLPTQTLALNYSNLIRTRPTENLIQFGLLPEDEAKSAALYAHQNNYQNALVLSSNDPLSQRLSTAFAKHYNELGGNTLETIILPKDSYDYSKQLRAALHINYSKSRHQRLQSKLATKLKFEPTIRQDINVIYIATDVDQAKLIKPQLLFFRAKAIPVLASSRINPPNTPAPRNRDLDNIFFTQSAWELSPNEPKASLQHVINDNWPNLSAYTKFFALGSDAFKVLPHLEQLKTQPEHKYSGNTGELTLDKNQQLHRNLHWGTFDKNKPLFFAAPAQSIQPEAPPTEPIQ